MSLQTSLLSLAAPALRLHESYAHQLVHDLDEQQMDVCPGPGHENTPRFTLGHLCTGTAVFAKSLEEKVGIVAPHAWQLPVGYGDMFQRRGPRDRRLPERFDCVPTKEELLLQYCASHERMLDALSQATDADLEREAAWALSHHMPRQADMVQFYLLHEMMHLGQLAAWRRAMGLPAAMARMVELRI